jgi:uncharacterized protein DUF6602
MRHDIHDFIRKAQADLQEEYLRIQKRAAEDPGTAGDQGEENWAALFKEWLPQYFQVVTKGRILTDSGYASPQMDVLVLLPSYPHILRDKKLYLSGGVAAAFECKITLTAAHVKEAVATSAALKAALPTRQGSPYKELHAGIIFGVLSHSHCWQSENSQPVANVEKALWEGDAVSVHHPRECIDFVAVSDLATWQSIKTTFLSAGYFPGNVERQKNLGPGPASTGYVCHAIEGPGQNRHFSPIGALLSGLFSRLAWTLPEMRHLEEYFRLVNLRGTGQGRLRDWPIDIYSEGIRERLVAGQLSIGIPYDEWAISF